MKRTTANLKSSNSSFSFQGVVLPYHMGSFEGRMPAWYLEAGKVKERAIGAASRLRPALGPRTGLEFEEPETSQVLLAEPPSKLMLRYGAWHGRILIRIADIKWVPYLVCLYIAFVLDDMTKRTLSGIDHSEFGYGSDLLQDLVSVLSEHGYDTKDILKTVAGTRDRRMLVELWSEFVKLATSKDSPLFIREKDKLAMIGIFPWGDVHTQKNMGNHVTSGQYRLHTGSP